MFYLLAYSSYLLSASSYSVLLTTLSSCPFQVSNYYRRLLAKSKQILRAWRTFLSRSRNRLALGWLSIDYLPHRLSDSVFQYGLHVLLADPLMDICGDTRPLRILQHELSAMRPIDKHNYLPFVIAHFIRPHHRAILVAAVIKIVLL